MIRTLGRVALTSGERLRVAALEAPAGRYAAAIRHFLEHKGQPWLAHVDLANRGEVDALRTTYYVGLLDRRIVGNVMIVGDGRAGILGHVFTHPAHRRKGICTHLMAAAVADFRQGGSLAMGLGTGYDSPPYHIYASFGFRGAFMLTGPLVGYYLDIWGMAATLYLLALATLVIFVTLVLPLLLAVRGLPTNAELERREAEAATG